MNPVRRFIARAIVKLHEHTLKMPEGCPHCGFQTVASDDYDECPWCGWGEDTEPERTPKEAREKFLKNIGPFSR